MGVIKAGEFTFFECNVAFHLIRENVYCPWVVIGVYFTSPKYHDCRYLPGYERIREEFNDELDEADSEYIRGGREFLENWRKRFQAPTDVISPIINYCTGYTGEFRDLLIHLFTKYAGTCSPSSFAMLTVMLKSRDRYFPSMFKDGKDRPKVIAALKEAQLI